MLYGYLSKTKHYAIRYRTELPDCSHPPVQEFDWERTVYGKIVEEIPKDAPDPLGNEVVTMMFLDANLMHDVLTGRSVTAMLHFFNTTAGDWYSKRQQLWRIQPMDLNLLQLRQQQSKSLRSDKPSGTLESLSSQSHTCLETTSLFPQVLPLHILV